MLTGFVVSVLTVQFLEFELNAPLKYQFDSAPALTIGLLIIPLFDTLRVFVLRLSNGKSPFKADRNHLHHGLLNLGLSHLEVTIIMISFNLLIFIMVILLQGLGDVLLIILITLLGVLFSFLPRILKRYRANGTKVSK
jgi:UDP-N-acetylmuramyl pentapeptide phosphotransferase/UDP-N-acetylglucosamine-1-phosphate transferase